MIVAEKQALTIKAGDASANSRFDRFGDLMPDGRLTEPSAAPQYRLREAIMLSRKLGRQLTENEMAQFIIA